MTPDQQTLMATECATCGGPLPYSGVGRPRKFCDDCRPAWFPPLRGASTAEDRTGRCSQCGVAIHYSNRGRPKKYCDRCGYHGPAWDYRRMDHYTIPDGDVLRLIRRFHGQCAYCRSAPYEQLDHVIPVSRGGRHSIGNLVPACAKCNNSKGARTVTEWKRSKRRAAGCQELTGKVNRPVRDESVRGMVRRSDPDTSVVAARIANLTAGTVRGKCLLALADAGERGLTDHELGAKVGRQQTSAGKRRLELQECGYVENTYEKRPTPSRAVAAVWKVTPAGVARARELRGTA